MTCADDRWTWIDENPDADDLQVQLTALGPMLLHHRVWRPVETVTAIDDYQPSAT